MSPSPDATLKESTAPSSERLIVTFARQYILVMPKDYLKKRGDNWAAHIAEIASGDRRTWTDPLDIVEVLDAAAHVDAELQVMHPRGGDSDVTGAALSREPRCIEVQTGGATLIIRPAELRLELFPGEHSYFWLSTEKLEPTDVYGSDHRHDRTTEELTDLRTHYTSRGVWDEGRINDHEPLPDDARVVVRNLSGTYIFMTKGSPFFLTWTGAAAPQDGLTGRQFHEQFGSWLKKLHS